MKRAQRVSAAGALVVDDIATGHPGPLYSGERGTTARVRVLERPDGTLGVVRATVCADGTRDDSAFFARSIPEVIDGLGDDPQARRVGARLRTHLARRARPAML